MLRWWLVDVLNTEQQEPLHDRFLGSNTIVLTGINTGGKMLRSNARLTLSVACKISKAPEGEVLLLFRLLFFARFDSCLLGRLVG
jgi:hypothetical protein